MALWYTTNKHQQCAVLAASVFEYKHHCTKLPFDKTSTGDRFSNYLAWLYFSLELLTVGRFKNLMDLLQINNFQNPLQTSVFSDSLIFLGKKINVMKIHYCHISKQNRILDSWNSMTSKVLDWIICHSNFITMPYWNNIFPKSYTIITDKAWSKMWHCVWV